MFKNSLQKGDRVFHVATKRYGKVYNQPRESSRSICVLIDERKCAEYFDVMGLRFVLPDGTVWEDAPIEGEVPPASPDVSRLSNQPDELARLFQRKKSILLDLLVVEEALIRLAPMKGRGL